MNVPVAAPRILVVEPDILARTLVAAYLRECGYQVDEAATGEEALAVLESGRAIDIVFAEVNLPGTLDGFTLAQRARRARSAVKVILTTGAERTADQAGRLCEHGPLLAKPYDHADLARRIRALAHAPAVPS
jgi:CheY-like chemotaxis protein